MGNPFGELEAWWEAAAPEDGNACTRLLTLRTRREGYRLLFETVDDANAKAVWRLDIEEVEEAIWRDEYGEPQWSNDHILLAPYDPDGALLSFSKPFKDPLRAWGAVAKAHRDLVGGWFPLERFFRTDLLHSNFGQLAVGPVRLLGPYAEALREVGEEFGDFPHDRPWLMKEPAPTLLTWGTSYFVARSFRLNRRS